MTTILEYHFVFLMNLTLAKQGVGPALICPYVRCYNDS